MSKKTRERRKAKQVEKRRAAKMIAQVAKQASGTKNTGESQSVKTPASSTPTHKIYTAQTRERAGTLKAYWFEFAFIGAAVVIGFIAKYFF